MPRDRKKKAEAPPDNLTSPPVSSQRPPDATRSRAQFERVASRAYELYIARGGKDGMALDDWLAAEQEILQMAGAGGGDKRRR